MADVGEASDQQVEGAQRGLGLAMGGLGLGELMVECFVVAVDAAGVFEQFQAPRVGAAGVLPDEAVEGVEDIAA